MSAAVTRLREKHDGDLGGRPGHRRDAVRLWLRLLSCTMVIEKRLKRDLADRFATTLPRFDVLAALDRAPDGLSMGALGRALLVSNGNITGLVQTLARDGEVAIAAAPGDRRSAIVTLTDAGRDRFTAMAAAHHGWIETMFAGLSATQTAELLALLDSLKASIAAAAPETDA